MNKKSTIINIVVVSALGTLLHFLYDLCNQNAFVGIFSAVNESIWEHQKLLFFPTFAVSIVEFLICKDCKKGFFMSRLLGVLSGIVIIITLYYTITGIIGKNIDVINIALFYLGVIATFLLSNVYKKNRVLSGKYSNIIAFAIFVGIAVLFGIFTTNPPAIGIFDDPQAIKNDTGN